MSAPDSGARARRWGLGLIYALCWILPFRLPLAAALGSWFKFAPDGLIGIYAVYCALWCLRTRTRLRWRKADGAFALFLLFGLVSTLFVNHIPLIRYLHQVRSFGMYYLLAFALRQAGVGRESLPGVLRQLQWVSWPVAALGIVERLFSKTVLFSQSAARAIYSFDNLGRVYSAFQNPNTYAMFLTILLLLSLLLQLRGEKKTPLPLYIQLAVMMVLTMSRASLLLLAGLLPVLAVLLGKPLWKRWKALLPRCALIALCAAAVSLLLPRGAEAIYFAGVQKVLEGGDLRSEMSLKVTPVTFTGADGSDYQGYYFCDITYVDERCAIPLREAGAVIHLESGDVTLPVADNERREAWIYSNAVLKSFHVSSRTRLSALTQARTYQVQVNGRVSSVLTALRIAKDHPVFGTGFGTYGSASSSAWTPPTCADYGVAQGFYADCQYSSTLAETGFVGLGLLLLFLFTVVWENRKCLPAVVLCLILGWYGVFFNMLEVHIGAFLLWTLLQLGQDTDISLQSLKHSLDVC